VFGRFATTLTASIDSSPEAGRKYVQRYLAGPGILFSPPLGRTLVKG